MKIAEYIKSSAAAGFEIYTGDPFRIHTDTVKFMMSHYASPETHDRDRIMNLEVEPYQVNLMDKETYDHSLNANTSEVADPEDMPILVIILEQKQIDELNTYYMDTVIQPASSGFHEYVCVPYNGDRYDSMEDLMDEVRVNCVSQGKSIYILGQDELPDEVEDIRGYVLNEPILIYAVVDGDDVLYAGIEEFYNTENN